MRRNITTGRDMQRTKQIVVQETAMIIIVAWSFIELIVVYK